MTDFLYDPGTNGFVTAPISLMTTELNSLASGGAATSSVNGSSGKFTQSSLGSCIWGTPYFTAGGTFTPSAGAFLAAWFLLSTDGGTTFETAIATASTTVPALPRSPDIIFPLAAAAHASGNIEWAQGRRILLPAESYKLVVQNLSGGTLPSSGNIISCGSLAIKF